MAFGSFNNTPEYSQEFQKKLKQYEEDEKRAMSDNDDDSYKVELYVYDMSKGLAKQMSPALLGKQIEGVWHTGVVAYGREYFFGSGGIESCRPGGTILGEPDRVEDLGCSQVPYQLFLEYIFGLGESSYKPGAYDLLKHNCNNFSEEVSEFLCGRGIPKNILTLPDEVLNTDLGTILASLAKTLQLKDTRSVPFGGAENNINSYVPRELRRQVEDPELEALNSAIEEVRQNTQLLENRRNSLNEKLLRKDKKDRKKEKREKEKKKKKDRSSVDLGEDKESRRRRKRGDSAHTETDPEEPSEEVLSHRRFSEPIDIPVAEAHPSRLPRSPTRHHSHLPPPVPKKSPQHSPSQRLELPLSCSLTPSPVPSIEVTPTSPGMDEEGADVSLPDISPVPPEDTQPVSREAPEEEELPPEVPREPPILFKEEVDVSSRGSFGDVWSSPRSCSLSSLSSTSSSEEGDYSSSSNSSSLSSYSSSSYSYSCRSHSSLASSPHSVHDSFTDAFSNKSPGTSIDIPVYVVTGKEPSANSTVSNQNLIPLSSPNDKVNLEEAGDCNRGSFADNFNANISNITFTPRNSPIFDCMRLGFDGNANALDNGNQIKAFYNINCGKTQKNNNLRSASYSLHSPVARKMLNCEHSTNVKESFSLTSLIPSNDQFALPSKTNNSSLDTTATSVIGNAKRDSDRTLPIPSAAPLLVENKGCFEKIRNDVIIDLICNTTDATAALTPTVSCTLDNNFNCTNNDKNINLMCDYSSEIIPRNYSKKMIFNTAVETRFKMPKESRPTDLPIKKSYKPKDSSDILNSVDRQLSPEAKNDAIHVDFSSRKSNSCVAVKESSKNLKCEVSNSQKEFVKSIAESPLKTEKVSGIASPALPEPKLQNSWEYSKVVAETEATDFQTNSMHTERYVNFRSSHRPKSKYLLERLGFQEQFSENLQTAPKENDSREITNKQTERANVIPLPWHPSLSSTIYRQPHPISSHTSKTHSQKSYESDSDSYYTPDSNLSHFSFPPPNDSQDLKAEISCDNDTTDSEMYHTPLSSCPPVNFDSERCNTSADNLARQVPVDSLVNITNSNSAQSQASQIATSNSDYLNNCSSSFTGISSSPQNLFLLMPAETKNKASSEASESDYSCPTDPTPPFSPISCTASERLSQTDSDEAKSRNVGRRLPPSYEGAISDKSNRASCSPTNSNSFSSSELDSKLSRSSTQSSVDSSTFGSSYYTLYIVDPLMRPKTPEDSLWSPENSPPPEDLSRSSSTCSVDSLRTITPEPEYFEENTRAFRAMRGLSVASSNESLVTCCSQPRSLGSTPTLEENPVDSPNRNSLQMRFPSTSCEKFSERPFKRLPVPAFHSDPSTPSKEAKHFPKRITSLDSIHSVLRRYPDIKSPFGSISTFALGSSSRSPSPQPRNEESSDRPRSTDTPILFDSPNSSQESLLLFRPLPRYNANSASPEPAPAVLCFLGPARPYEPPFTFNICHETVADFDGFVHFVADMLNETEQKHMEELRAYVVEDEGSWALGEDFNTLFAKIFHDPAILMDGQRHLIRIMAAAALKDDVILMLHQDRKEHTIMNFANKIESHPPEIQEALALFFCNMFEHLSPSEWLLYISEWQEGSQQISNIRVTTKIAVNALLHSNPKVQEYGTALMYNLGTKEVKTVVFDDVAPELAMAILQYIGSTPSEEYVWRVMTALCRFCYASSEVPALIKMIGPDPHTFKGMSERIDTVLEEIIGKLSRVRAF